MSTFLMFVKNLIGFIGIVAAVVLWILLSLVAVSCIHSYVIPLGLASQIGVLMMFVFFPAIAGACWMKAKQDIAYKEKQKRFREKMER